MIDLEQIKLMDNKIEVFRNKNLFDIYIKNQDDFIELFECLTDEEKLEVLNNTKLIFEIGLNNNLDRLLSSMSQEAKEQFVSDIELVEKLGAIRIAVTIDGDVSTRGSKVACETLLNMQNDTIKLKYLEKEPKLIKYLKFLKSITNETQQDMIINGKIENIRNIKILLASMESNNLIQFIANNQDFLKERNIRIFDIFKEMQKHNSEENILDFIYNLPQTTISEYECKLILGSLKNELKEIVDLSKIDKKYEYLINMRLINDKEPDIDVDDLSIYSGLDEILTVHVDMKELGNADILKKLDDLSRVVPNIKMFYQTYDKIEKPMTGETFSKGYEWIMGILNNIDPSWTTLQKMAYIHTAIGKDISYTPEQDTEVEKEEQFNMFETMKSGEGVCAAIAEIECMLFRLEGIDSEVQDSEKQPNNKYTHAFVLVKNIELPSENGTIIGDTYLDPTWDLMSSKFSCFRDFFCITYERLQELDEKGYHILQNPPSDSIGLDEKNVRKIFKSIGQTDEKGLGLFGKTLDKIDEIDDTEMSMKEKIEEKFKIIEADFPDLKNHMHEVMKLLVHVVLWENSKFTYEKVIVKRVFNKSDEEKKAVLYVFVKLKDGNNLFYYLDRAEEGGFKNISQEEFEERFECYEEDLKENNNKIPWKEYTDVKYNNRDKDDENEKGDL